MYVHRYIHMKLMRCAASRTKSVANGKRYFSTRWCFECMRGYVFAFIYICEAATSDCSMSETAFFNSSWRTSNILIWIAAKIICMHTHLPSRVIHSWRVLSYLSSLLTWMHYVHWVYHLCTGAPYLIRDMRLVVFPTKEGCLRMTEGFLFQVRNKYSEGLLFPVIHQTMSSWNFPFWLMHLTSCSRMRMRKMKADSKRLC